MSHIIDAATGSTIVWQEPLNEKMHCMYVDNQDDNLLYLLPEPRDWQRGIFGPCRVECDDVHHYSIVGRVEGGIHITIPMNHTIVPNGGWNALHAFQQYTELKQQFKITPANNTAIPGGKSDAFQAAHCISKAVFLDKDIPEEAKLWFLIESLFVLDSYDKVHLLQEIINFNRHTRSTPSRPDQAPSLVHET